MAAQPRGYRRHSGIARCDGVGAAGGKSINGLADIDLDGVIGVATKEPLAVSRIHGRSAWFGLAATRAFYVWGCCIETLDARDISCIVCIVVWDFSSEGTVCPASEKCVQALEIRELAKRVREVVLSPSADRHGLDFELWAADLEQEAADLEREAAFLPA